MRSLCQLVPSIEHDTCLGRVRQLLAQAQLEATPGGWPSYGAGQSERHPANSPRRPVATMRLKPDTSEARSPILTPTLAAVPGNQPKYPAAWVDAPGGHGLGFHIASPR